MSSGRPRKAKRVRGPHISGGPWGTSGMLKELGGVGDSLKGGIQLRPPGRRLGYRAGGRLSPRRLQPRTSIYPHEQIWREGEERCMPWFPLILPLKHRIVGRAECFWKSLEKAAKSWLEQQSDNVRVAGALWRDICCQGAPYHSVPPQPNSLQLPTQGP